MTSPISKRKVSHGAGNGGPPTKSTERPFYVAPENKPTPVQIMNENRSWLQTVNTRRPFTPRDDTRSLFGQTTSRPVESRPPSAFSLGARHFDESRPPSGTRLTPLEPRGRAGDGDAVLPPKPPSADRSSSGRRKPIVITRAATLGQTNVISQSNSDQFSKRSESLNNLLGTDDDQSPSAESTSPTSSQRSSITSFMPSETQKPPTSPIRKVLETGKPDSGYMSEHRGHSGGSSRGSSAGTTAVASTASTVTRTHSGSSSRGGSAGKKSQTVGVDEVEEDSTFYDANVAPIVDLLSAPTSELADLLELSDLLYKQLEQGNLLEKRCRHRAHILKTVFRLLDKTDPRLHMSIARIILALKVSGNNLNNICKLIYKVAKEQVNDQLFVDNRMAKLIVKTMNSADVSQSYEALVYLTGAVKFLTSNPTLVDQMAKYGCIEALATLQASIVTHNAEAGKINEQLAHILVQTSGALRNLAAVDGVREILLRSNCIGSLVTVLEQYPSDYDLAFNISRILSRMSQHTDCCQQLSTNIQFCLVCRNLLIKYYAREELVVRLCFVLGNLTARCEDSRQSLFPDKSTLNSFLKVFDHYMKTTASKSSATSPSSSTVSSVPGVVGSKGSTTGGKGTGSSTDKQEEVLVKIVRLLANSCISEHVGRIIASSRSCLGFMLSIVGNRKVSESEELVLNSISAINNMSYYMVTEVGPDMQARQLKVAETLISLVMHEDHLGVLKCAIGVFGNLSRERHIRDFLIDRQMDRILLMLLDSGRQETVYCTVGVLLNLMADSDRRHLLTKDNGVKKLFDVLRDFGGTDWQLAGLVCKTLWNYTELITSTETTLGDPGLAQDLIDLLSDFTDAEIVLAFGAQGDVDPDTASFMQEMWETDFLPVAGKLLSRLEAHQSQFEPL